MVQRETQKNRPFSTCPVYDGGDDVVSGVEEEVNCFRGFVREKSVMESPD